MKVLVPLALVLFLLPASCGSQQQPPPEIQPDLQPPYMNETYENLNKSLEAEVKAGHVEIKQLKNRLQVTLANEILFPEDGWEVGPKGIDVLMKVAPSLENLNGKRVIVQGFTDNVPVEETLRTRFPTYWELSASRATNVVRHLQAQGVDPATLAAEAFGQYHPVVPNDTAEGKRKNQRINIVIEDAGM